jgi:flagellar protein FlbB
MANYPRARAWPKIMLYLFLVLALFFGGIFWFDVLGLINATDLFRPVLSLVGLGPELPPIPEDEMLLLDSLRIQRLDESVSLRLQDIERSRNELHSLEEQVSQRLDELREREIAQEERENSFNDLVRQYDNRRANLIRISQDLTSMRPGEAVAILVGYDDQLLIDTLRITQELADQSGEVSLVSVWLALMPPQRAADLQRKMALRPSS